MNLTQKIIKEHIVSGVMNPGEEISIRIDQTLTQDATGTMAYLQFEAMGLSQVKTKLSVSYVDHNMLQQGFENADDHIFLQSIAARYGIIFSKPGNGICHQVHRERFGIPGQTLLGSDSHTPTCGGLGMLAIGAGGLDVAVAMGGGPFYLNMPVVVGVKLTGELQPWVGGKDIILEILRRLTVKGGTGKVFEYFGPGVKSLAATDRFTITNMGAELGATTSIFPSDERTREFLKAQGREVDWVAIEAEPSAGYDEELEINLDGLVPMIAQPHSPDNVVSVREAVGIPVQQACIGSCTNSSYHDLAIAATMLKGRVVHPDVSMTVTPGSKSVYETVAASGVLADLISAGCRILESACGPCIGMGQAPPSNGVSVRSFNRNFEGRSGTKDARVYLASPETTVACAIAGVIADPRELGITWPGREEPKQYVVNDVGIIKPPIKAEEREKIEVLRGPNIKPLPVNTPIKPKLSGEVLLKVGDNISTDHILPAGAKVLPLRSNVPAISEYVFSRVDETFATRAKEKKGGFVVGGANYGQGSSREHAALAPMFLGVKAVIAKQFARIHRANLINFGIVPLTFTADKDFDVIEKGDVLEIDVQPILDGQEIVMIFVASKGIQIPVRHDLTERQRAILKAGGLLNYTVSQS
jgi:aconitate hydratase